MKHLIIWAVVWMFLLGSCTTSRITASFYDDVYQSTHNTETADQVTVPQTHGTYSEGTTQYYQQSVTPQQQPLSESSTEESPSSYGNISYPESSGQDYPYDDFSSRYYDYSFEERINRFHRPTIGFSYFHPIYSGYCFMPYYGSSWSFYYGWGWPYYSFSFCWGWGYPGYYSPWFYDPWFYDPWFYPTWYSWRYYPWYYSPWHSSYWYWRGFWDGYYAGNWFYPGEILYRDYYYGPRTPRGSSLIGYPETRESRISGQDSQFKGTAVSTRESRMGGDMQGQMKTTGEATPERPSRILPPETGTPEIQQPSTTVRESRQEKLPTPETTPTIPISTQRPERENIAIPQVITPERTTRTDPERRVMAPERTDPSQHQGNPDVINRERRYAKPQSNDLQRQSQPRVYTSPNANRPRSSMEFVVPSPQPLPPPSRQSQDIPRQDNLRNQIGNQSPTKGTVSPSRSEIQFPEPSRNNPSLSQPPRISRPETPAKEQPPVRTPGNISSPSFTPRSAPPVSTPSTGNSPRNTGISPGSSGNSSGSSGERKSR